MNPQLTLPAFGDIESVRVLAADDLFAVVSDKFPISPGHTLIIARRPVARFHDLTADEKARLMAWIDWTQQHLTSHLNPNPDAFNFGLNDGPAAGQTIPQFHFHIIPRYTGDVAAPRGGIRHVIPSKACYWHASPTPATAPPNPLGVSPVETKTTKPISANGLSVRAARCLAKAGVPLDKDAIVQMLSTGRLFPYVWPASYGRKTHAEVCRFAGIDPKTLPPPAHEGPVTTYPGIGLSYRAWRCLCRAGIPATKEAVRHALATGSLSPGKRPGCYGQATHAEISRWAA